MFTFIRDDIPGVAPDPIDFGPGTPTPWVFDLTTNEGWKQLDVAIAGLYRITKWELSGNVGGDTLSGYQLGLLPVLLPYSDERCLAARNIIYPDSPAGFDYQTIYLDDSDTWARIGSNFYSPDPPFSIRIVRDAEAETEMAYVSGRFWANPPVVDLSLDTVQFNPLNIVQNGTVKFRVPAWPGTGTYHEFETPLYAQAATPVANFICTGVESRAYEDGEGEKVWDPANAGMLLNPYEAHINIP
jgi:hypothetical protein